MRADKGLTKEEYFGGRCEAVRSFFDQHGRWPTVYSKDATERSLGAWCHKIRVLFGKGQLPGPKMAQLQSIGFAFRVKVDDWPQRMAALKPYLQKGELPPEGSTAQQFLLTAVTIYRHFSEEKRQKLDDLGVIEFYNVRRLTPESAWYAQAFNLLSFYDMHGTLPTRRSDAHLENWVNLQRRRLKGGKLETWQVEFLAEGGINLLERAKPLALYGPFGRRAESWLRRLSAYKTYLEQNGRRPLSSVDINTWVWVNRQPQLYEEGKLGPWHIEKLKEVAILPQD